MVHDELSFGIIYLRISQNRNISIHLGNCGTNSPLSVSENESQ